MNSVECIIGIVPNSFFVSSLAFVESTAMMVLMDLDQRQIWKQNGITEYGRYYSPLFTLYSMICWRLEETIQVALTVSNCSCKLGGQNRGFKDIFQIYSVGCVT